MRRWRELFDVISGALAMRFTHARTYLKFAAAFALLGAAAALTASFLVDKQYVATATMRIEATQPPANGGQAFEANALHRSKPNSSAARPFPV